MPRSQPSDDANDGDSGDVEYGIRRARMRTTLLHRDSSSLYPSHFIEVEYYLAASQHSLRMAMPFVHLVVDYASLFRHVIMVTMVVVLVDWQWQQRQCCPSVGGVCWQPLEGCALWTPVLSAKLGLREFLYRVYDATFLVFEEGKCHICCKFHYSKFGVGLNGHRTFSQKHEI